MTTIIERAGRLNANDAATVAQDVWGLGGAAVAEELPSERDQNFLLRAEGCLWVLKVARPSDPRGLLEAQNEALLRVRSATGRFAVPLPRPSRRGSLIEETVDGDGVTRLARVLSFVRGVPLARFDKDALAADLGGVLGELARALAGFRHPAVARALHWDVRRAPEIVAEHGPEIVDPSHRALVARVLESVTPAYDGLEALRVGVVHNDANDYNVLVADGRVAGVLDFGDLLESVVVAEAAVGLAYAMLGARDPLGVAVRLAAAFHDRFPLDEPEASAILPLALARLCASVTLAAHQRRLLPQNEYLSISERYAWQLLETFPLARIDAESKRVAAACTPRPSRHRSTAALLEARKRVLGSSLSLSYSHPLHIVRGAGTYLYDAQGRRYLDCVNNVCHVGHSHPRVVEAAVRQAFELNTNTRYLHENVLEYAERLAATLPEPLQVCYFVCSGSEANELALRLARTHTGRNDIVVLDSAYHGNTSSLVELSPYKFDGRGGAGKPDHVHVAPLPDTYRGHHRGPDAGSRYADEVLAALAAGGAAAFFAESLPGCGGQIVPPRGFLSAAFDHARVTGAVAVADEVQVGLGRVGERFWGFELDSAVPDIVTSGKPIGNGHPLGAVVTTRAIADSFDNGMEYFNTFGGNPVSCAVGLAVLDVIHEERLQDRARDVGAQLLSGLRELAERNALVGDVRGAGLYVGVELVRDRETLEPAGDEASRVVDLACERGVLLSTDGPHHNVIKIKPPLVFSRDDADLLVHVLDESVGSAERTAS